MDFYDAEYLFWETPIMFWKWYICPTAAVHKKLLYCIVQYQK